jgi:hypothetical protein
MTKEALQTHLAELKRQQEQILGNANALAGAVQFCEILIQECDQPEPTPAEKA